MKKILCSFFFSIIEVVSFAQYQSNLSQTAWVDSVFSSLDNAEKISQLILIRALPNDTGISRPADLIKTYHVGSLCFFQGGPIRQANATNYYQSITSIPLL
jgi:hypothetical protein